MPEVGPVLGYLFKDFGVALRCNKVLAVVNNRVGKPGIMLQWVHNHQRRGLNALVNAILVSPVHANKLYALLTQLTDFLNILG